MSCWAQRSGFSPLKRMARSSLVQCSGGQNTAKKPWRAHESTGRVAGLCSPRMERLAQRRSPVRRPSGRPLVTAQPCAAPVGPRVCRVHQDRVRRYSTRMRPQIGASLLARVHSQAAHDFDSVRRAYATGSCSGRVRQRRMLQRSRGNATPKSRHAEAISSLGSSDRRAHFAHHLVQSPSRRLIIADIEREQADGSRAVPFSLHPTEPDPSRICHRTFPATARGIAIGHCDETGFVVDEATRWTACRTQPRRSCYGVGFPARRKILSPPDIEVVVVTPHWTVREGNLMSPERLERDVITGAAVGRGVESGSDACVLKRHQ
jgi:hypothetical protein